MAFCSQCGYSVSQNMRFCPSCGTQLAAETALSAEAISYADASHQTQAGDFKVVLIRCGTCRIADAVPLLEDLLGYNAAQARGLIQAAPTEIARNLTLTQAQYLAQALTEYGMEVSITNTAGDYYDSTSTASSSVFDRAGNFLPSIAGALALLGIANRVHRISRWQPVGPPPPVFRLGFRRPVPMMHFRRTPLHRPPMPAPVANPFRPAAPKMPPRPPRPMGGMGGPRPAGGRGPRGGRGSFGRGGGFGSRR